MGVIVRGIKNAFRNVIRAGSIAVILGLSIGLALVMLVSLTTIQAKIDQVKSSIGNTITIAPAGARGFEGGGEPLTETLLAKIKSLSHITSIDLALNDRARTDDTTSLKSAVDAGSLGKRMIQFERRGGGNNATFESSDEAAPSAEEISIPITITGISNTADLSSYLEETPTITSGEVFGSGSAENVAVIGKTLAEKNSLATGSTFTLYDKEFKVAAIYDAGNDFANNQVIVPLSVLQTVSEQADQVSTAIAKVDSISNMSAVTEAVKNALGETADVTSTEEQAADAIAPLENIKTISLYSLIGSLAAGAIIIFLTMLMIVRERRREIGVLKALGASNLRVVGQFVAEASTFTVMGGVLGLVIGFVLSNPVLQALANNTAGTATNGPMNQMAGPGGGMARVGGPIIKTIGSALNPTETLANLQAQMGFEVLLYGLATVIVIAVLGSAIPAFMTAKVRPAEVLRGE